MAKSIYIGVDGVAKKAKNIYIGVDGKARKVAKAYIGDADGKARLFYIGDEFQALLVDFEYTNNGNGTATITGWKGTLNGVASTEMVIPNDPRIIL